MKLKFYHILAFFLLSMFILSLRTNTTVAEDNDDDDIDDSIEDLNIRKVEIKWESSKFEIESTKRTGNVKNEIEFEIEYNSDGLSIQNEYNTDNGTAEFELEFKVNFKKLIEYNDTDSDGVYNKSNDDTVQEIKLGDDPGYTFQTPPNYTTEDLSIDTKLHYFIINTTNGVFTAYIYVVEEFALVNNSVITPFEVKVDIEINNFNFLSPISKLAIYTKLESEAEYETDEYTEDENKGYAVNESSFAAAANSTVGFFSWAETAEVDSITTQVLISNKEVDDDDPNEEKIYLNYERGAHIYHDPKIGMSGLVRYPLSSGSSSSSSSTKEKEAIPGFEIAILLGVASVATISLIYLKQKKIKR
jgi:hypothetical protein